MEPQAPGWEDPGELALPPDLPWEQQLNLAQGGAPPLSSGSTPLGIGLPSLWGLLGLYLGWLSPPAQPGMCFCHPILPPQLQPSAELD